jgi:hypothetical protein
MSDMYFCFWTALYPSYCDHGLKYNILFLNLNVGRENCKEETEGAGLPTEQAEIEIDEKLQEVELRCHGPLFKVRFAVPSTIGECQACPWCDATTRISTEAKLAYISNGQGASPTSYSFIEDQTLWLKDGMICNLVHNTVSFLIEEGLMCND